MLEGVGNGCGFVAEVADCERDWECDIAVEEGDLLSEGAAAVFMAGAPLACEPIEGHGGEVGVRG